MLGFLRTTKRKKHSSTATDGTSAALFEQADHGNATRTLPGITEAKRAQMAMRPPSFTDLLPWMECDKDGVILLEDGISCGRMYELDPIPTEGSDEAYIAECMRKVKSALSSQPEWDEAQWVIQVFVNDDTGLDTLVERFSEYVLQAQGDAESQRRKAREVLESEFTQSFIAEMAAHLKSVAKPEGFFRDESVSDNLWRGQFRRVRLALYRRYPHNYNFANDPASPRDMLIQTANGLISGLREAGVRSRLMRAADFYSWLLPFFNPRPFGDIATTISEILRRCPLPEHSSDGPEPFGVDMGDQLLLSPPESDPLTGTWRFNGRPMRALALQGIREPPQGGHFTAERAYGAKRFARFDRMPPGTMLSCTMVVYPQDMIKARIQGIQAASRAKTPDAAIVHKESRNVLQWMAKGDKLYPFYMVLYLRGEDDHELQTHIAEVTASLTSSGLRFIDPRHELVGCDVFMRGLPMGFDPQFDSRELRRSRLVWASQIAALLPLYGRARGTGNPGIWLWNRGGEPLFCDPLNKRDRKKNAHMLIFGPTGAGKSALLNYLCMLVMAIYRVRLVIVDAGNSMGLLSDHFASLGLTVHKLRFTPDSKESLPPFADACQLLDDPSVAERLAADNSPSSDTEPLLDTIASELGTDDDSAVEDKRDLLGEMVITASLMITGGERREIEKMSRADRYLIEQALLSAARTAKQAGQPHPRVQDVAQALMGMRTSDNLGDVRKERAEEMGQAMMVFCNGLRGQLFNGYGTHWPNVDVVHVEMGTLAMSSYEDALSVAYTSLVSHVHALAEAKQYEGRPIIFLTDEGHLVTKNQLLSDYVVKITKMWRKLGCWFWLATQNMQDFPDDVARILSMCEWWWLLTMPPDEIDHVARFKTLTLEQRRLMESATKEPPKYTEGVVISSVMQALFRNVPPALPIALAMTEMHEKAERKTIMDEHGCSELEAAVIVARKLAARREYA